MESKPWSEIFYFILFGFNVTFNVLYRLYHEWVVSRAEGTCTIPLGHILQCELPVIGMQLLIFYIGSGPSFKPLTSEVGGKGVTHYHHWTCSRHLNQLILCQTG